VFADNALFIEADLGEQMEMTLENGRRNLFWEKDYQILSEWAAERKPVPCELPTQNDSSLINTGVALDTEIEPDPVGEARGLVFKLTGPVAGGSRSAGRLMWRAFS
jgi:hypothetical protein